MAPPRPASIFNLFRFVTALATVLVSNGVMAAGAPAADDVRHVLLLLAAAGEEYREGVQDGRVVRAVEVEEAGALVQEARSRWQRVSGAFPGHDLSRGFDELGQAVSETLLADDLVRKVAALRRQVSAVSGVAEVVRPPKVPSADRGQQLFSRYCIPCHGERGDGKGPSAAVLTPAPTDFTDPRFMRAGPQGTYRGTLSAPASGAACARKRCGSAPLGRHDQ